jgi:hypothetical protein
MQKTFPSSWSQYLKQSKKVVYDKNDKTQGQTVQNSPRRGILDTAIARKMGGEDGDFVA